MINKEKIGAFSKFRKKRKEKVDSFTRTLEYIPFFPKIGSLKRKAKRGVLYTFGFFNSPEGRMGYFVFLRRNKKAGATFFVSIWTEIKKQKLFFRLYLECMKPTILFSHL